MRNKLIIIVAFFVLTLLFTFPLSIFAQTPNEPCPLINGKNICDTAIGKIDANDTTKVIQVIFQFVVSIAGIGSIILFLVGGYRIMLSRGDKEKLHEARDTITSAVLGLIFIILSLVILQIIGFSILQIPGFAPQ